MSSLFAQIIPLQKYAAPLTLTYEIPDEIKKNIAIGSLANIPLQNRLHRGIVVGIDGHSPPFPTRKIQDLIFLEPLLEPWQIEIAGFIADYYLSSLSKTIKLFLPAKLSLPKKKPTINPSDETAKKKFPKEKKLTSTQQQVIKEIETGNNQNYLLHGITGSGKTEIFKQLVRIYAAQKKQTLLLVPEINLTPQLIEYFTDDFAGKIAVIHSRLTDTTRYHEWLRIKKNDALLIIGSRSALFSPFQNLAAIIMDEEHEWTYKQENAPRYHAKTVAQKIAALKGAKIIFASATPSIETYYEAKQGEHQLLELPHRINHSLPDAAADQDQTGILPTNFIVDMREEIKKGNFSIFSELLSEKLEKTVKNKRKAILFLNRRGYYSQQLCRDCGQAVKCPYCEISMVTHKTMNRSNSHLICHYCGLVKNIPLVCPICNSQRIKTFGIGTQMVEEEVRKCWPTIRTIRADSDTIRNKKNLEKMYRDFKYGDCSILIGTQMIAKGLDIPEVDLVGIILADIGLHVPNFRSRERIFQIITQVAGRAGRRLKQGEVVIQTYAPQDNAIKKAANHDYQGFYHDEIDIRQKLSYPPFIKLAKLTLEEKKFETALQKIKKLETFLAKNDVNVQAVPAIPPRLREKYRFTIFIKNHHPQKIILGIPPKILKDWKIDIDPL